ncbi:TetR family transcriptional regulator C-terminal domain-containing protein [Pseudemcibacter aquimaris]|uniref:TetR family transcriptional regulator C-terminal domain-containing protein n=1 Tax=Pseudemcibacter aquimaris TaxID=2857064 RepID=UPI0020130B5D|nr:TetR family transcriptional regulator C-terminal domain-containing protein [Pseudemcibacter aquimaris]MCC3861515.1 TetR family transcriptional regulator C-terminal domain-containing protein [Pseudemcibacter aquimaris]WDU58284.1 TetR family transcriptional regulator C-terminal domain-containing protein [Pseudemcibacter aquimaris]
MTVQRKTGSRRAGKEYRKRQLIEAAIDSIAKRGLGDTTLSHVAKTAGLSQGIINLHFTSKENLLNETIHYVRSEYQENWKAALEKASSEPAAKLAALLKSDYHRKVADVKKLAVWFAFWGEAKSRPVYKKISQERVADYSEVLEETLIALIEEGQYKIDDLDALIGGIVAMADGLWLNILISSGKGLKRSDAENIMMQYLCQIFPKHKEFFN